jgi:hypothetical protein
MLSGQALANYAACWARNVLKHTKEPAKRDTLAKRFVEESKALFPVVNMCRWILPPKPGAQDEEDEKLVTPEAAAVIRGNLEARLKQWAVQGNLLKHPHISRLYWSWMNFSEVDASAWARQQIKTPLSALALLRAFVGESTSNPIGSHYVSKQKILNMKSLEEVVPLTDWDRAFAEIKKHALSPDDSANLAVYEYAKKRRKKGLPDNDWRTMRDDFEEGE